MERGVETERGEGGEGTAVRPASPRCAPLRPPHRRRTPLSGHRPATSASRADSSPGACGRHAFGPPAGLPRPLVRPPDACMQEAGVPAGASGAERAERAVDVAVRRPRLLEPCRHSLTRPRERGGKERPPGVPSENAGRPWASGSTPKRERPDPARATPDPARARPDPARARPEPAPAAGSERRQASQDLGVGEGSEGRRKRWSPATCIAPRRSAAASGRAGAGSPPRAEPGRAAASALLSPSPPRRAAPLPPPPPCREALPRSPERRPAPRPSRRQTRLRRQQERETEAGSASAALEAGVSRPPRGGGCEMRVNQSGMKIRVR